MACTHEPLLKAHGQEGVLRYWTELSDAEKAALTQEIEEVERRVGLGQLANIVKETAAAAAGNDGAQKIEPPSADALAYADQPGEALEAWEALGYEQVSLGRCAACVMAGGQGTRLGRTFPKGIMGDGKVDGADFGLLSKQSLFELQANRLKKVQEVAAARYPQNAATCIVPFLVMTSHATHDETQGFFEANNYFGLDRAQVRFFHQGRMPCLHEDGRIVLRAKGGIQMAPDGNGGIYDGLNDSGTLQYLEERGVAWLQVFSVDNILVKVADPVLFGFCQQRGLAACSKTIPKKDASEAVGVFAKRNDQYGVIEYSEIGPERAALTDDAGRLLYGAANPAIHAFSLPFLKGGALEFCKQANIWHRASKKIASVEGDISGLKMELFIFDAFSVAEPFGLLQVDRQTEFSAIKNADDKPRDTPRTACADLARLHKSWLARHGVDVGDRHIEIHPSMSYSGEGLEDVAKQWPEIEKTLKDGEPYLFKQ